MRARLQPQTLRRIQYCSAETEGRPMFSAVLEKQLRLGAGLYTIL